MILSCRFLILDFLGVDNIMSALKFFLLSTNYIIERIKIYFVKILIDRIPLLIILTKVYIS